MNKIDMTKLSTMIKEKRKELNITQYKLGEITGINRQVIGRIESGKLIPSVQQIDAIVNSLEIEFSEILTKKDDEDVFIAIRGEAKTKAEREGFEKLISMMICLKKHDRLRRIYSNDRC